MWVHSVHIRHKKLICGHNWGTLDITRFIRWVRIMKTDLVKMRLSLAEKVTFQEAANLAGIPLSAWMRERLRRAAVRELEDASMPIAFLQNPNLR